MLQIPAQLWLAAMDFYPELVARAANSAVASMSTSALALLSGVAYGIYRVCLTYKRDGWRGVKDHLAKDALHAAVFALVWWGILFSYHLFIKVPREIRQEAAVANPPRLRTTPIAPPTQKPIPTEERRIAELEGELENTPLDYRNIERVSNRRLALELRTDGKMYREFERQYNQYMDDHQVDIFHMPQNFSQYVASSAQPAKILIEEVRKRLHDSSQINGDVSNALNGAIITGKQHQYSAAADFMEKLASRLDKTGN